MLTSGDARRRILLYFLLGIALPSGLLGYLALRGIRNDEALLERERREQLTQVARRSVRSIEARLDRLAALLAAPDRGFDPGRDSLVRAVFFMDREAGIRFSVPGPIYLAEPSRGRASVVDPALLASARHAARTHQYGQAARDYQRLATQFALARTEGGLAVGPSARLELSAVLAAAGDTAGAHRTLRDLFDNLLTGQVPLTRSELDFFAGQAREHAVRLGLDSAELGALATAEAEARRRTEEMLAFATAGPALQGRRPASDTLSIAQRMVVESGGRSFFLLMHPFRRGQRGVLLDAEVLGREAARILESEDIAAWVIRGPDRQPIAGSADSPGAAAAVTLGFAGGFPPWVVELSPPSGSLLQGVFAPGRRVYLFAFVLLAGILLFGLTLTARVVSRELELARMKSDFVATVSHEFRSPLTAVRQLAAMLRSGQVPSEERRHQYYEVLVSQSERLSHLVENALETARLDERSGAIAPQPVDVRALVEEVAAAAQQRVAHQGFRVVAEIEEQMPAARLDRETIARALGNLIDNAIKYSGDSRDVVVRGFRDNAHLVLSVRDWGAGLHPEEQQKVFERFYRGGNAMTRAVRGTGLGLTLVKKIAEAHGGTVQVVSAPGQGSTFAIHLPIGTP